MAEQLGWIKVHMTDQGQVLVTPGKKAPTDRQLKTVLRWCESTKGTIKITGLIWKLARSRRLAPPKRRKNKVKTMKNVLKAVQNAVHAALDKLIPLGYEDSKGFHYGHSRETAPNPS